MYTCAQRRFGVTPYSQPQENKSDPRRAWLGDAYLMAELILFSNPEMRFTGEDTKGAQLVSKLFGLAGRTIGAGRVAKAVAPLIEEYQHGTVRKKTE